MAAEAATVVRDPAVSAANDRAVAVRHRAHRALTTTVTVATTSELEMTAPVPHTYVHPSPFRFAFSIEISSCRMTPPDTLPRPPRLAMHIVLSTVKWHPILLRRCIPQPIRCTAPRRNSRHCHPVRRRRERRTNDHWWMASTRRFYDQQTREIFCCCC